MEQIHFNNTVLKQTLSALMLRNRVTSMNIANIETPGYTRKQVEFEESLAQALRDSQAQGSAASIDVSVSETDVKPILEEELLMLADTQARAHLLLRDIRHRFSMMQSAIRAR
jgi:flagellar basal-body rod protein FlgB